MKSFKLRKIGNHWYPCIDHELGDPINLTEKVDRYLNILDLSKSGEITVELEELGIVKFHGFQSDPKPFYASSDAIVLPSYHEGMSNVLLEGASTGRPLITSHIPGCQEAVEDKVTGYLTEVKNSDDLYEKMKDMLHLTSSQREEMGKQGRSKMEREFDKKQVVKETIDALKL